MCIAILNLKGTLSKETLQTCWNSNPHGAGLIYNNPDGLQIFKELKSFQVFYNEYIKQRKLNKRSKFAIHFRISTSGKIDLTNCHPFEINKDTAFIHNGMIDIKPLNKKVSDTFTFNELIFKKLGKDWQSNKAMIELLENYIYGSKRVVLNSDNSHVILNEDSGHWDEDNWYSNNSYRPYKIPTFKKYDSYKDYFYKEDIRETYTDFCESCLEESETIYLRDYNMNCCSKCAELWQPSKISKYLNHAI